MSSRSVQAALLASMLGASIALSIQSGLTDPSIWIGVGIVSLVLHAVNFYHAKMTVLDEARYLELAARPIVRNSLLLVNTLLFLVFCSIAAKIGDPWYIAGGEVMLRAIDIGIVLTDLRIGDKSNPLQRLQDLVRRQLVFWLRFDAFALAVFTVILVTLHYISTGIRYPLTVCTLAVLVFVDLAIEYIYFQKNYFSDNLHEWNRLAERWDRLQGANGDRYRQEILHPFLYDWAMSLSIDACVDLGCGNGCTVRSLLETGQISSAIGVDISSRLIDFAGLYEAKRRVSGEASRDVEFIQMRIDKKNKDLSGPEREQYEKLHASLDGIRNRNNAVGFISMFGAQDCVDLEGFFFFAQDMIVDSEQLILVFEAPASFEPSNLHSATHRTWKYTLRKSRGRVQVVTWLPTPITQASSLFWGGRADSEEWVKTETHFRISDEYIRAGVSAGFIPTSCGKIQISRAPTSPFELDYQREPKFEFIQFARIGSEPLH